MDDSSQPVQLPILREHEFQSHVPIVGALIGWARRSVYRLTARWGVWSVIGQQNHINQIVAQHLNEQQAIGTQHRHEFDRRLIELDRELTHLRRTLAELEVRQRQLAKLIPSHREAETEGSDSPVT